MEFANFSEMIRHASRISLEIDEGIHQGLKAACGVILEDTREMHGEYQQGMGPFATWQPLAESTKADRITQGFTEDDPLLRTGDLRDSYYTAVKGLEGGVGSELEKALAQETGDPIHNVPARSTLGLAFTRREDVAFRQTGEHIEAVFIRGGV